MNLLLMKVTFCADGSRRITGQIVFLAASLAFILLASITLAEEFTSSKLSGHVVDNAGQPIAGANVYINRYEGRLDPAQKAVRGWQTITDSEGKYELTLRYPKVETFVAQEIFAEAKGYVCGWSGREVSFKGGNSATVDLHLDRGEVIAGIIRLPPTPLQRDNATEPSEGKQIHAFVIDGPSVLHMPQNARLFTTDEQGRFEVYLPQGEYTVRILDYDNEPLEFKGIKAGQRRLELTRVPSFEWTTENVGKVFDEFYDSMDQNYSYFFLKKDVDWKSLRDKYRPVALQATDAKEFTAVLKDLLAPLNDMHVWISTPSGIVPTAKMGGYVYNGNLKVTLAQLDDRTECGKFATVGRTKPDGFGCFLMLQQSAANDEDVKKAVRTIRKFCDAPGFVVDLRNANGGSEPQACEIARLFCTKDIVYAKSKYRNGRDHQQFTEAFDRVLSSTPGAFVKPVVCLIGPGAVSSGEGFVEMMKCLPHVTTIGMPTRGASGNPKAISLGRTGLVVYYSSWVDMLPNGETFEGVGIAPDVRVDLPRAVYVNADPSLEMGLDVLRMKVAVK